MGQQAMFFNRVLSIRNPQLLIPNALADDGFWTSGLGNDVLPMVEPLHEARLDGAGPGLNIAKPSSSICRSQTHRPVAC